MVLNTCLPGQQGKHVQFIWAWRIYADEPIMWFVVSQKDAYGEITKQWISYLKSSNSLKTFEDIKGFPNSAEGNNDSLQGNHLEWNDGWYGS